MPGCTWASKLARECEIKHWYACGADGRTVHGHVNTKFSRLHRIFLAMGLRARGAQLQMYAFTDGTAHKNDILVYQEVLLWYSEPGRDACWT